MVGKTDRPPQRLLAQLSWRRQGSFLNVNIRKVSHHNDDLACCAGRQALREFAVVLEDQRSSHVVLGNVREKSARFEMRRKKEGQM